MIGNVLKFYKDLLEIADLSLDEEDNIVFIGSRGNKIPITVDGKPLALPTPDNIKKAISVEDGEIVVNKILFNPLEESAIRGDNKSFLKLLEIIERKLNHAFAAVGETIFSALAKQVELNDPDLIKFVERVLEYKAPQVKQVVDDNTVGHWVELFKAVKNLDTTELFIHIYIKKGGKIDGVRYNRTAVTMFPIYEKLAELKKNEPLHGVKLRKKDVHTFKVFHEFTFNSEPEALLRGIMFGSKNNTSPGMHALIMAYEFLKDSINAMIDSIIADGLDVEDMEELRLPDMPFTPEDFEKFLDEVKMELKEIPSEADLILTAKAVGADKYEEEVERMLGGGPKSTSTSGASVKDKMQQSSSDDEDEVLKALIARGGGMPGPYTASGFSHGQRPASGMVRNAAAEIWSGGSYGYGYQQPPTYQHPPYPEQHPAFGQPTYPGHGGEYYPPTDPYGYGLRG